MFKIFAILCSLYKVIIADIATEDIQFLNELPLQKLLKLKTSLQELVTTEYEYENDTATTPSYLQTFGAQAMAFKAPPIRRGDYEEGIQKTEHYSKISNIFSMSVTTLAFLAFGGYLLCLIVQAVKSKQTFDFNVPTPQPPTFLVSAGIKKKPKPQFSSYGRRRRDNSEAMRLRQMDIPPDQLFSALLHLCEGYAKWSERYRDTKGFQN